MQNNDELFEKANDTIKRLKAAMSTSLVGKSDVVDAVLTALVSNGHVLLEGVPGLAKTLAVKTFAGLAGLSYKRVQFTPDLLPGDVTGTIFYDAKTSSFVPRKGPIFANIILADEINRAPAKVQSALLESMEEGQVTLGSESLKLPEPFLVLATQNPIEHEGTFRLPEAQLDRFMLKLLLNYPSEAEELDIMLRYAVPKNKATEQAILSADDIAALRQATMLVRFEKEAADYVVRLVRSTRPSNSADASHKLKELHKYIEYGASPRASIALYRAAKAFALFSGRQYVLPDDIKATALMVLRHRLIVSYEADADRVSSDHIIKELLSIVAVP